jgi:aminocarboxymuconate-semialdehyde decarboxylase
MPISFAGSDDDPQFGIRLSLMINQRRVELIATHPGRFGAFAALPAKAPKRRWRELM